MLQETTQQHEARYYAAYAEEFRAQFAEGMLAELADLPQFVVWRQQAIDGKPKKPPYSPRFHRLADTSNPASWGTLDQALQALSTGQYNGIGFVFSEADPYAGMDLDHCVGNNRAIDTWAQDIIDALATHTHYSPRDGVHLIFAVNKTYFPGPNRKVGNIEFFTKNHFMTITPRRVHGITPTIEQRHVEASYLYLSVVPQELWAPPVQNTRGSGVLTGPGQEERTLHSSQENTLAVSQRKEGGKLDVQVIDDALAHPNSNFARYWSGNPDVWTGESALKPSRSEAMFALLILLADKTGDNEEQVKRLYKRSGMYLPERDDRYAGRDRETGQKVTYLDMSARNAIRKRQQYTHKPGSPQKK